ncbi:MAG: hypothetical protein ABEJ03_04625 [Candidatus Nanohaloarchaea archaeon]
MVAGPDLNDLENLFLAAAAITVALTGFYGSLESSSIRNASIAASAALLSREVLQRAVARFIKTEVHTELSKTGTALTVAAGVFSYVTSTPVVFAVTVFSEFSNRRYESWGYSIDVPWVKRRYWMAWTGIAGMLLTAFAAHSLQAYTVSRSISIIALFALLPMKENLLVEGETDGARILIHSGFMWLLLTGLALLGAVSPL